MIMRKVFRPHIILCIGGRLFTLLLIAIPLYMTFGCVYYGFFDGSIEIQFVLLTIFAIGLDILCVFILRVFWQLIWGKLIITSQKIIWRCPFCRTVKISYSEIAYIGVRGFNERNVIRVDIYSTGFKYLLISNKVVPYKVPINKIRCKKGLIKWAYSPKVCEVLKNVVPKQFAIVLK